MREYPKKGDIIYINFNPQAGKEIMKSRPAIVLSETIFNSKGFAFVCPITSTNTKNPFHRELPEGIAVKGVAVPEQTKSIDFRAREWRKVCECPHNFLVSVKKIIHKIMPLE